MRQHRMFRQCLNSFDVKITAGVTLKINWAEKRRPFMLVLQLAITNLKGFHPILDETLTDGSAICCHEKNHLLQITPRDPKKIQKDLFLENV